MFLRRSIGLFLEFIQSRILSKEELSGYIVCYCGVFFVIESS